MNADKLADQIEELPRRVGKLHTYIHASSTGQHDVLAQAIPALRTALDDLQAAERDALNLIDNEAVRDIVINAHDVTEE